MFSCFPVTLKWRNVQYIARVGLCSEYGNQAYLSKNFIVMLTASLCTSEDSRERARKERKVEEDIS